MNRRSFFTRVAGGFVAAVATTVLAKQPQRVVEYRKNTTPQPNVLTYEGKPLVFDKHAARNTVYFLNPETVFYNDGSGWKRPFLQ